MEMSYGLKSKFIISRYVVIKGEICYWQRELLFILFIYSLNELNIELEYSDCVLFALFFGKSVSSYKFNLIQGGSSMTPVNKRLLSRREANQLGMNFVKDMNWRYLCCRTYIDGYSEAYMLHIKISPTDVVDGFSMRCFLCLENDFDQLYQVHCFTEGNRAMFNDVSSFFTFLSNDVIWNRGIEFSKDNYEYDDGYEYDTKTKIGLVPQKYSFVYDSDFACEMYVTVIYEFSDPKINLLYGLKGLVGHFSFGSAFVDYSIEGIQDNLCSSETVNVKDSIGISDITSLFFDQHKTLDICEKIMDDYVKTQIWGKGLAL